MENSSSEKKAATSIILERDGGFSLQVRDRLREARYAIGFYDKFPDRLVIYREPDTKSVSLPLLLLCSDYVERRVALGKEWE